ncbi:MAG: twin-arginine translocation signal domain-containing protein [Acidobacteria bacterium]|nr:twin-arginine translocation signal domain-containing protein [Acidobacteriota bacterium]
MFETNLDRRNFLRGSALFAAAVGLTVVAPAAAQELDQQKPKEEKNSSGGDDKKSGGSSQKTSTDEDGRAYRICPQCAYNMYKQGRMWVCDNCGYSYVE